MIVDSGEKTIAACRQRRLIYFIATGGYSGLSPLMPGTAGSIAAFVILAALQSAFPPLAQWQAMALLSLATFFVGVYCAAQICSALGADAGGAGPHGESQDPRFVVIDEFAGFFVAAAITGAGLLPLFIALVFFRMFDITKPWPIRSLEGLPGGWGVMADDIAAGVAAGIVGKVLVSFI